MSFTWSQESCPKCHKMNWANLGDWEDITGVDPSGILKCWNCGERFWVHDDITAFDSYDLDKTEEENFNEIEADDGYEYPGYSGRECQRQECTNKSKKRQHEIQGFKVEIHLCDGCDEKLSKD